MSASQTKYYSALVLVSLTIACRSSGGFNPNPPFLSGRDISPDGVWERLVSETFVFDGSVVKVTPRSYAAFRLKATALDDMLSRAPLEFTSNDQYPVVLTLPQPNGSFGRFQIEESPIMEPELAKRFPMIKTYRGKGLDDRTATARFERSRRGLHAMVLSASGAFLVDAIGRSDANLYVSYFKSSLPPDPDEIACRFSRKIPAPVRGKQPRPPSSAPTPSPAPTPGPASSPGVLRTYRLAVAASHLYVEAIHNLSDPNEPSIGPLEEAVTAITRTIDRVNIIFERDVGIHLTLVNNEDRIIHTDASTDPYHDFADDEALLRLNQSQLDDIIHPENYDVGHLFLVSRGGVAAEPCACSPFYKGEGLSGSPHPTGGAFDVQYVSHEIGHQFGASHSFNGTTKGCKYRNSETAYEPGSGSTIMGYSSATKICEQETIQSTADPYFHAISLQEIRRFVTRSGSDGGDSCAQKSQTGNRFAPQVSGGPNFTIPGRTPFALTVASSSDGDGDALTFTWEEFDRGPPDPPHPENPNDHRKKRPLFRSWPGSSDITRSFPALNFILNPPPAGTYVAEALPANNRIMLFRVTARDGRGLYGFADVRVNVISKRGPADVGPFEITQPAEAAVWPRGSTQTVSWSVARTDLAPIDCTRVRILLVIRGDENHPIVLAANVANDSTAQITLPNNLPPTTMARIKVEAINNIFFDISKADIQIIGP